MSKGKMVSVSVVIEECNDFLDQAMKLNYFTVSKKLQEEKKVECENAIQQIKAYKQQAISDQNELYANAFFYLQCTVNALISSLTVWCKIKEESYVDAWHKLVDAQEYVEVALKIQNEEGTQSFAQHLAAMEKTIFRGWSLFNSAGIIEEGAGECSICSLDFSECEHIENQIYMGKFCRRVNLKVKELNHVALVKNPRDRRCVITEFTDKDGVNTDHLTLEEITREKDEDDKPGTFRSVMLTQGKMDLS